MPLLFLPLFFGCDGHIIQTQPVEPHGTTTAATPAAPIDEAAKWRITKNVNELDGKTTITLRNENITIRCGSKFEAYVDPPLTNLGHMLDTSTNREQRVRYRLDGGPLRSGSWSVSTSFDALFIPTSTLRQIVHSRKLTYEYKPEYTVSETDSIDLTGLATAMKNAGCRN